MRTIEESRAILKRWAEKTGGQFEPNAGDRACFPRAWDDHERLVYSNCHEDEATALSAAADWALQDCPGILEGRPRDRLSPTDKRRSILESVRVAGVAHDRAGSTKYAAFDNPKAVLRELRDWDRIYPTGDDYCEIGHERIFLKTRAAAIAHCGKHGLDVSEWKACGWCNEPVATQDQILNSAFPNAVFCRSCFKPEQKTEEQKPAADVSDAEAARAAARATAARLTLAKYPGLTLSDLKAELEAVRRRCGISGAMLTLAEAAGARTVKQYRDDRDVDAEWQALFNAICWLEEGNSR